MKKVLQLVEKYSKQGRDIEEILFKLMIDDNLSIEEAETATMTYFYKDKVSVSKSLRNTFRALSTREELAKSILKRNVKISQEEFDKVLSEAEALLNLHYSHDPEDYHAGTVYERDGQMFFVEWDQYKWDRMRTEEDNVFIIQVLFYERKHPFHHVKQVLISKEFSRRIPYKGRQCIKRATSKAASTISKLISNTIRNIENDQKEIVLV